MNILVTGANGFIGRKLCEKLTPGNTVIGIGRHNTQIKDVVYMQADITDKEILKKLFIQYHFDAVYHLASVTFHDDIVNQKQKTLEISLKGTENLVTLFNEYCSNAKFIYTSTGKVYGGKHDEPISENIIITPDNILGKSKYLTEQLIDYYAPDNKSNQFTILRIFNVYGYGQRESFVIPHIIKHIKENQTIPLGNLNDKRDYVYISDVIDCLISILNNTCSYKQNLERFNVGTGRANSVRDILNNIENMLGRKLEIKVIDDRKRNDESSIEYCDYSKLKQFFNWDPKVSLYDGLLKILREENLI